MGNQVIDLGHFDLQYEFFLRNTKKIIKIPYKYVAEVEGGQYNISPITDSEYFDQIKLFLFIFNISFIKKIDWKDKFINLLLTIS